MGPTGNVFVLNSDGTLTGFYEGRSGPHPLSGWSSEISAGQGPGGLVFAIGTGGVVYVNHISGNFYTWLDMGDPLGQPVSHISAGLDGNGNDVVYAIGSDGLIYGHDANWDRPGSRWYLVDNSGNFTQLSATVHNEVFAIDQFGSLHQIDNSVGVDDEMTTPSGRPIIALSTAARVPYYWGARVDEVYVIDTNGDAYEYHTWNGWNTQRVDYGVSEIAAIGGDQYYDVHNHHLYFEINNYEEGSYFYAGAWVL
jgi:hypothetical protein